MEKKQYDLKSIASNFQIYGDFEKAMPHGSGHINDTFAVTFWQAGREVRYILQRVNHYVFKRVPELMQNVERVTAHLRQKMQDAGQLELSRRALTLIKTHDGATYHVDAEGNFWRVYLFIESAKTHDVVEVPDQAREAARAFGRFQGLLADLGGGRLQETIPGFHDTPSRFANLEKSIAADKHNRAAQAKEEIANALAEKEMVGRLLALHKAGQIPERVTHNDTKINNVMLDIHTGEGICVIDLDTVMPGLALYDFGDMVRTATSTAREDELDLTKVSVNMPQFEAIVQGYLSTAGSFLVPAEVDNLAFSGQLITFEIGIRFLTDFLDGDVYFKIHRPLQNLERFRVQYKMFQELRARQDKMEALVRRFCSR
jgi:aminoglycoside phosphotransferase (APT) family kinase protein